MARYHCILLSLCAAAMFLVVTNHGCSSQTALTRGGLGTVLPSLPDCGDPENPCIIDDGGDGGDPPVIVNPQGTPIASFTPVPQPTAVPTAVITPGQPTPTPTPPVVRDDSGSCYNAGIGMSVAVDVKDDGTFKPNLPTAQAYIVSISSNSVNATFDMSLMSKLERILVYTTGNSNRVTFKNADMKVGMCNEMSGGSNGQKFENCTAVIADLMSGSGGKNKLDERCTLSWGLNFDLSGNNHCISGPAGTVVKNDESNDNGHKIYLDPSPPFDGSGTFCLP